MLRAVATIGGFAIVAFSIGFNTMRYPVVWEMTAPARANEPAHPAAALPPEKPEHLAPAAPPQAVPPPVVRSEIKPIPEPAETNGRDNPLPPEVQSLPPAAATPDAATAATRPETQKPLVPVTTVSAPTMPNGGAAWAAGVQRLPSVEPAASDRAFLGSGRASDGVIPIYPSTGIR